MENKEPNHIRSDRFGEMADLIDPNLMIKFSPESFGRIAREIERWRRLRMRREGESALSNG
jgi:hypothetical protein